MSYLHGFSLDVMLRIPPNPSTSSVAPQLAQTVAPGLLGALHTWHILSLLPSV